jgi:aminoglycoside phosphotransferase (APT) family kinase protein
VTGPAVEDLARVAAWMDSIGLGGGPVEDVEPLAGGTQNQMLRFRRGGRAYVLRRPPPHPRPRSNEALVREMRVLEALTGTGVPAPGLVAGCADPTVLGGAVFYLMESVAGFNCTTTLPPLHAGLASVRRDMGLHAVAAAASIADVDLAATGLGSLGDASGFLERQVPRWTAELDSYAAMQGYPGPDLPGLDAVASWLEANRPRTWASGLMHGDFHLANLMFEPHGPQVAAVVDWEMATVGVPLVDLGWLLATWPAADGQGAVGSPSAIGAAGGLPSRAELVAHYAELTGRDVSDATWYQVLACFKLGILLEGTYARSCGGRAPRETGERLHVGARRLFEQAHELV